MKKRIIPVILMLSLFAGIMTGSASALAGVDEKQSHAYCIYINGFLLDTEKLPFSAYTVCDDEITEYMVPLRLICEKLGFLVSWDPKTGQIGVDNGIAKMTMTNGCMKVDLELIINNETYNFKIPLVFPVRIHDGHTFIPLSLLACFRLSTYRCGENISVDTITEQP